MFRNAIVMGIPAIILAIIGFSRQSAHAKAERQLVLQIEQQRLSAIEKQRQETSAQNKAARQRYMAEHQMILRLKTLCRVLICLK